MTFPMLLFALLVALLYGVLFHIGLGGGGWRLLLYLGLSILGFAAGVLIGFWQGWVLFKFGALDLGLGTLGSFAFLATGEWLSRIEVKDESSV